MMDEVEFDLRVQFADEAAQVFLPEVVINAAGGAGRLAAGTSTGARAAI